MAACGCGTGPRGWGAWVGHRISRQRGTSRSCWWSKGEAPILIGRSPSFATASLHFYALGSVSASLQTSHRMLRSKRPSLPLGRAGTRILQRYAPKLTRALTTGSTEEDTVYPPHFRATGLEHPFKTKEAYIERERIMADKFGRQQNHIWSEPELQQALATAHDKHTPQTITDHLMYSIMQYGLYHPFNLITGYKHEDPSPQSIEWRLIVLESFAGVPGFVAAGFRHFRSLRALQRDYGWIHTLLEEAENERMHLLVCLKMAEAGPVTRFMCVGAQLALTPFLMGVYMLNPKAAHRFVGYLEQTACETYHNIITHIETPGTKLNAAWAVTPAPEIAKGYWHLPEDAKWVDALRCIYADGTSACGSNSLAVAQCCTRMLRHASVTSVAVGCLGDCRVPPPRRKSHVC